MRNNSILTLLISMCAYGFSITALANGNLYSFTPGAFIYHAYAPGKSYNQYFNNKYLALEKKWSNDSTYSYSAGTLLNSYSDRCIMLGVRKDWYRNEAWTFKGGYAYIGEFFIKQFSHCGDDGIYEDFQHVTGIGFAPYIYNAIQYDFNSYVGAEAGIILPGVLVLSMQIHF